MCRLEWPSWFFFFRQVEHLHSNYFSFCNKQWEGFMDIFQLETQLVMAKLGALLIPPASLFKTPSLLQDLCSLLTFSNSSLSFLLYFSAIVVILFLIFLSLACGVLCSPFCTLPRALFNLITIFLPLCIPFLQGCCFSPLVPCSSLLSFN